MISVLLAGIVVVEYVRYSEQIVRYTEFVGNIRIVALATASIVVDQVLEMASIEVVEDMLAGDIRDRFLIVGDIQFETTGVGFEAVADLV